MSDKVVLNLTPDPKVLIALMHTDIQPLDALCELIDNAIVSFALAKLQGINIPMGSDEFNNAAVAYSKENPFCKKD